MNTPRSILPLPSRQDRRRRRPHLVPDRRVFLRFSNPDRPAPAWAVVPVPSLPQVVTSPVSATFSVSTASEHHFHHVHVWSAADWDRLPVKPTDAVEVNGYRIALRIA